MLSTACGLRANPRSKRRACLSENFTSARFFCAGEAEDVEVAEAERFGPEDELPAEGDLEGFGDLRELELLPSVLAFFFFGALSSLRFCLGFEWLPPLEAGRLFAEDFAILRCGPDASSDPTPFFFAKAANGTSSLSSLSNSLSSLESCLGLFCGEDDFWATGAGAGVGFVA